MSRREAPYRFGVYPFDPIVVGHRECEAWAAYYRREWFRFLIYSVMIVRAAFGLRWRLTFRGAWWVLRANQVWAPFPDNDPEAARQFMRRFYRMLIAERRLSFDPTRAAQLEVEWWRVHREAQHAERASGGDSASETELVRVLNELYAYIYVTGAEVTRPAARLRVLAMDRSDRWVAEGCDRHNLLLAAERQALVESYGALRATMLPTPL